MLRIILLFFPKKYISYLKTRDQKSKYLFKYERLNLILTHWCIIVTLKYIKKIDHRTALLSKKNLLQKWRNTEEGAISEAFENSSRKLARQDVSEAVKEIGSANIENNGVDKIGI